MGETGVSSIFFGSATAIELADGNVTIQFTVAPEHIAYYDWVEIRAYAVAEGSTGAITGKIHTPLGPAPRVERARGISEEPLV